MACWHCVVITAHNVFQVLDLILLVLNILPFVTREYVPDGWCI